METMSDRLRTFRTRLGLSAKEVAIDIGVPESTYRAWEMGRAISGEPYLKLAEVLRVSLGELFTGEKPNASELDFALERLREATARLESVRIRM
jgi:transcriptional regulator with XRE-family HTH domain